MSIFKKIGSAVKKGLKQVSLKNIVKVGTPLLSSIPVVGGLAQNVVSNISAAHEAKKQEEKSIADGNAQMAEYYRQVAEQQAILAGAQTGQQAGSVLNAFSKGATNELIAQTNQSAKGVVGMVGADVADESIKAWFVKHWIHLLIGVGVIFAGFKFWKKSGNTKRRRN